MAGSTGITVKPGMKIRVRIIRTGIDGRRDAYRYLAQLITAKVRTP